MSPWPPQLEYCLSLTASVDTPCCPCTAAARRHLPLLIFRGLFGTAAIAFSYAALLNLPLGDAGAGAGWLAVSVLAELVGWLAGGLAG